MRSTAVGSSGWTNGRKAKKKIVSLGLSKLINTALTITDQTGTGVSIRDLLVHNVTVIAVRLPGQEDRYATPTYFNA